MMQPFCRCVIVGCLAAPLAAQGYEWDHPDGVGVRYLLYKKMKQREVRPEFEGPDAKVAYVPTDPGDFVRVKGYPMEWGVLVYEFQKDAAPAAKGAAQGFAQFLREKDPCLKDHVRTVVVDGKPVPEQEGLLLWEFRDRFIPFAYAIDKTAPPGLRWAESPTVNVRFLIEKGMTWWGPSADTRRTKGPAYRGHLVAGKDSWLRVKGQDKPLGWLLHLYEYEDAEGFAAQFEKSDKHKRRTFTTRGEPWKLATGTARRWAWRDDPPEGSQAVVRQSVAALHAVGERHVALVMDYPSADAAVDPKMHKLASDLVGSLVAHKVAEMPPGVGSETLLLASCRTLGEKEVALVVTIPLTAEGKVDPALRAKAERIVKSLEPEPAK